MRRPIVLLLLCMAEVVVNSFAPSMGRAGLRTSSGQTELNGLRTFLKNKFSKSKELAVPGETILNIPLETNGTIVNSLASIPVPMDSATATAISTTQAPVLATQDLDKPFSLPDPDHKLSQLEQEFRDMLLDFSQFTLRDIRAVRNPRMRALFEGVAASYSLPKVYRAFEVLFEDYAPLRIAGRLIYGKLKQVMLEAQDERRQDIETVASSTGMAHHEIEASRAAFLKMVVHADDKATTMSLQQLVDYGLAETAVEVLGYSSFDEFLEVFDPKSNESIDFCELMVSLQMCSINNKGPECNCSTVLHEIASRLETRELELIESSDERKRKLNSRYDNMVSKFREWKTLVPAGDGRRLDILRGCFVGAESPEIVEALRIVYIDYSALRMSGDLIFKVMATLVGNRR